MPLDPTAVGATAPERTFSWTAEDVMLYAVGIGAGPAELAFATENSTGHDLRVYPTFAVVAGMAGTALEETAFQHIGTFDPAMLVHGTQSITLHRPIPSDFAATSRETVVGMYDKGKAAVVVLRTEAVGSDGAPLWTSESSAFIRGEGGWGGDRGPSAAAPAPPDRAPDHEITLPIPENQAFLYRLSGDHNPLHTDPEFAAKGGFDRPILHGLCTFGYTGRALLRAVCDDDVTRFDHIEGRFSAPVWPGDVLTVRGWRIADGQTAFSTSVGTRIVISQGLLRHR